jgi:hypothetical protein
VAVAKKAVSTIDGKKAYNLEINLKRIGLNQEQVVRVVLSVFII